ncbi:MAG: cytochrome d ubiquinol oxidase subunit II [Deltaproteobacteria bacterium]|nr:cytochrome d ubiquinol oxidase subunit II [Deltaproteobacteria bacterium]
MSGLQIAWFLLVGVLLCGYAVLDGFDLGVGLWHLLAPSEAQRRALLKIIGPVWDGNEVWLLAGGGALFAAFPPVYATVFSGLYLPLLLVVLGLIFRAVAIEVRGQIAAPSWRRAWDAAFALGSALPTVLFGVAVGNLVCGLELDSAGNYAGGLLGLLGAFPLLAGLSTVAMFATHGALLVAARSRGELAGWARQRAAAAAAAYAILAAGTAGWSLAAHQRGSALLPGLAAAVALGAIGVARAWSRRRADGRAFVASCLAIAAQVGAVGATLYPDLVPARGDPASSLTIFNASSSATTLTVMFVVALLGMPLVVGYTVFVYRVFWERIDAGPEGDAG